MSIGFLKHNLFFDNEYHIELFIVYINLYKGSGIGTYIENLTLELLI